MPWRNGWLPSCSRINKGGGEDSSRGAIERMIGDRSRHARLLPTQPVGRPSPKASYTSRLELVSASLQCRAIWRRGNLSTLASVGLGQEVSRTDGEVLVDVVTDLELLVHANR